MIRPVHLAFILEQTLGHITHGANLRSALSDTPGAQISWLPIEYETDDRWRHLPLIKRNWTATASLMARRQINHQLRRGPIDGLFFHTQVTALGALDLMRQRPTIVSLDATPLDFDSIGAAYNHRGGGLLAAPKHALTKLLFARATQLVAWSEWVKRSLVADYGVAPDKIAVIAPGTNLSLWQDDGYRIPTRPAADGPVQILFVGGDFARKGGNDLLAACRPWLPDRCTLHLVTREAVPEEPGVRVYSTLTPNSEALRQLYRQADLFVLPSYAEGLPLVLMEATAAGLPVIATDIAAIPEAVHHQRTGLLVRPGAVPELRAALQALIDDPNRRQAMGRAGRRLAEERFNAQANANQIRDQLIEAVARASGRSGYPFDAAREST